jgi:hypothetical protein
MHNGTNNTGLIVQNGNLSINSGMNASRAGLLFGYRARCHAQSHTLLASEGE